MLAEHKLYIKRSKCTFAQQSLKYLGHIISKAGVATDPTKIAAVANWPRPLNAKQLRAFLGTVGYDRKLIANFGAIARALTNLFKKNVPFIWTQQEQESFNTLKDAHITAPVLALPDFEQEFVVETDASDMLVSENKIRLSFSIG